MNSKFLVLEGNGETVRLVYELDDRDEAQRYAGKTSGMAYVKEVLDDWVSQYLETVKS